MSLADHNTARSLSDRLRRYESGYFGSENATGLSNPNESLPSRRPRVITYTATFDEQDSDDDLASLASSTTTNGVPPLTRGSSLDSCAASVAQTDVASVVQGGYVLESDDGILTLPHPQDEANADLLCPFQILDCFETFASVRQFKTHVFSHFRGEPLPKKASCFLCPNIYASDSDEDPAIPWNRMLGHMAHDHFRTGQEHGTFRADFALMRWMYDRKIIGDHMFKRTQMCPTPTVFPGASRRPSEASSIGIPEAPSPPASTSPSTAASVSVVWPRRSSYIQQTYVTFAGARHERRRRDSIRPLPHQMRAV